MGMLDYLQENWRDIYKPFQRYPEIYGEHARQGMSMLGEDAPGAWDVATKPMGALMTVSYTHLTLPTKRIV